MQTTTPTDYGRCAREGEHLRTQRHPASECPVGHVLPRDINTPPETEAQAALAETSTAGLLRAAYALTHRIHSHPGVRCWCVRPHADFPDVAHAPGAPGCDRSALSATKADLRAQRDLIDAEILRRTGDQA